MNMSERREDSGNDDILNRDNLEALFKQPEPTEECPICMIPLPLEPDKKFFHICCGKVICYGCCFAVTMEECEKEGVGACPFCREPKLEDDKTIVARVEKLAKKGNGAAFNLLAHFYFYGKHVERDVSKALELYKKGGEHGYAESYFDLAKTYHRGENGEADKEKAKHYYELAAKMGDVSARCILACLENKAGNTFLSYRHIIISARAGNEESIAELKNGYKGGFITKDEYAESLRLYQMRSNEMKSERREEAARYDELKNRQCAK
jgi:hypothetical protein